MGEAIWCGRLTRKVHAIMTGSFSWSLLLVALLPLLIAPAYCQHTEYCRLTFIFAIKTNDSGLEIYTLFPENRDSIDDTTANANGASQWFEHELEPQMYFFFPGCSLSSWCGDQYFRCQELLVETLSLQDDGIKLNIVFVPLENGILLLSNWYDLNTTSMEWSHFIVDSSNCSPTVLYKVSKHFYIIVCISSNDQCIAVYEVRLNLSGPMIENVTLLGPLTQINISNYSLSASSLSNFALVEHMVYFAVDNTIIVMDVYNSTRTQQYPELLNCTQIHKLVPTIGEGNQQLLVAYFTDRYSYFDPVYGNWTTMRTFSMYGVPYICPSDDYKVTLFNNSEGEHVLQFSVRGLLPNIIRNVSISSGICFKSQNRTYFAYSDQQHNSVFVFDFITKNYYPVSPHDCLDCPQLLLLDDQYLVVCDADHDLVLDTKTNFSLIVNISSGIPDILAVLLSNITIHNVITSSPPIIHSTTTAKVPPSTTVTSTLISTQTYSTTTVTVPPGMNVTSTLISTQIYSTSTVTVMNRTSTVTVISIPTYTNIITPSPLVVVTIHSTITAIVSLGTYSYTITPTYTSSITSLLSTFVDTTVTATPTVAPTHVSLPQSNLLGVILTVVIGLFVIIVILVTVAVGFSIQHWRDKW